MRTAALKFGSEPLFHRGWLIAVVGGTSVLLVALFLLTLPVAVGNGMGVWDSDLPRVERTIGPDPTNLLVVVAIPRSGDWLVRYNYVKSAALPTTLAAAFDEERKGVGIYAHAMAPAKSVRQAVQASITAGATSVEIRVRDPQGEASSIVVDLGRSLPDLRSEARVQELVDALARAR